MDNIWGANASVVPPSVPVAPSTGYPTDVGTPTQPGAWWFHMIAMEIYNAIVAGGVTPNYATVNQLTTAIRALALAQSLGVGQTVQSVLGSRAWSTTYTNTTGRPIFVNVAGTVNTAGAALVISINGSVNLEGTSAYQVNPGTVSSAFAIVPPGATYSVGVSTGTVGTLSLWTELR